MKGRFFEIQEEILDNRDEQTLNEDTIFPDFGSFALRSVPLKALRNQKTIVAVDVSSMNIGETETGVLCAIRGAIVWKEKTRYTYLRLGPFPFHITEENKGEVYHLLKRHYSTKTGESVPSLPKMQIRICNLLERWIQMNICSSQQYSIILWDGSLNAGTTDHSINVISQSLKIARTRLNTVIAFSKMTSLRLSGQRITDLLWKCRPPCLLEIGGFPISSYSTRFLGNIFVVKLTKGSCSFRVDIDRNFSYEQCIEAICQLLGNDLILQSYPETLRLAHIYSTFTANEVIGIQRFVTQQHGLKIIVRPNVRRILFGPFGKGLEV